jgi:regulator of nonsense transcripts 1
MEFENFQYDTASSYGGMSVVDDTSSVYTAGTSARDPLLPDLDALSISDKDSIAEERAHAHVQEQARLGGQRLNPVEEDIDGVLDDLKDEGNVNLPPHACR